MRELSSFRIGHKLFNYMGCININLMKILEMLIWKSFLITSGINLKKLLNKSNLALFLGFHQVSFINCTKFFKIQRVGKFFLLLPSPLRANSCMYATVLKVNWLFFINLQSLDNQLWWKAEFCTRNWKII